MIETIIYTIGLMLPSFILGYCVRWMNEERIIANKKTSNKESNILPPI
jgi:fructose-specific phosphotransferase system IIC component